MNRSALGNRPGAVSESIDHRSIRLFSTGVPVIASFVRAGTDRAAW